MYEDLNAHREGERSRSQGTDGVAPRHDREVPLGSTGGRIPSVVHAWLDGELPEAGVRLGDTARDVEFWSRVNGDLATRRAVRTPAGLEARIMAAIPQAAPQVVEPWYRSTMALHPAAVAVGAAGLLAVGAVLGMLL